MNNRYDAFLIKYAEIGIKGKNRHVFEEALVRQIKIALRPCEGRFSVIRTYGRIFVEAQSEYDFEEVTEALSHVFGIRGICPVAEYEIMPVGELCSTAAAFLQAEYPVDEGTGFGTGGAAGAADGSGTVCPDAKNGAHTFKVHTRRMNKQYPQDSLEVNALVGQAVLEACPNMSVDVHTPEIMLSIEIREKIYIYSQMIPGPGGLPVGVGGKCMLLLSGGIDSPVAGYMVAKRGVRIDAVYFNAPPYTSERALQKVVDLAREISVYTGPIRLHNINFTEIQLYIYEKCPHDELTIIMRRYMMRIAERLAKENDCLGLVTGESIGQVASQTLAALAVTNEVCTLPVFRPLVGFDKEEIIQISRRIGTFETSILPYEDCCTIFVAKHPVTKPRAEVIRRHEQFLNEKIDEMVERAIETDEIIQI
ncbi:MAG: tRNA uracil 4-sulfurtransferase ThiI [Eubacteriales bacterium]|nr:tRNA uracil 4-sulfurtransferase ThiI [Eubacteriales bacterium]